VAANRILMHRAWTSTTLLLVVIAGGATIYKARTLNDLATERRAYAIVISAIVVAAGFSVFLIWQAGQREDHARAKRRAANPYEPWIWWREDWAAGFAHDEKTRSVEEDWLLTNLAVALCAIVLLAAGPAWDEEMNPGRRPGFAAFAVVVSGAALGLGWRTVRRTMRRMRNGSAVCRFEKTPIRPGEVFRATIELPLDVWPSDSVVVSLACHQVFLQQVKDNDHLGSFRRARGSLGRPATRIRPALHAERFVAEGAVRTAAGIQIPISLRVPTSVAVKASRYNPQSALEWSLDVRAGKGPSARFTLPVFPNDVALA
jgi:hypothetical protein